MEAVLTTLINDLGAIDGDVVLVLDDYHLIESARVHEAMTFLLDHLPPQLHVVIATRADPPLSLARLRARGELVEVRAAELRFTNDETAAYLNQSMGLELTDRDVAALEGRTEGWIAALQLAALSMQGRDDATEFIAGFAGDDRYVVDYLVEEVVQRQPPQVQDFLLRTSVLTRLSGAAVRRGERRDRREGDAAGARARQPLPRPAGRPASVVPLPPPVRRRPAGAAAGRGTRAGAASCTVARAGGTPTTASRRRRSGTRWPVGTSRARRTWWSGA